MNNKKVSSELKVIARYIKDEDEIRNRRSELEKIRTQMNLKAEWPVFELALEYDGDEAWGTFGVRELRQMSPKKMQDVAKIINNTIEKIDKVLDTFKKKYPDVKILKDY